MLTPEIEYVGAYGLRLSGLDEAAALLVPAPPSWLALSVEAGSGEPDSDLDRVDDRRARLRMRSGGVIELQRDPPLARFLSPDVPRPEEIVHPYLAAVAAVMAFWHGRESFHAGGFLHAGGVWALLGDRGAGKSSTLAELASRGVGVACDDMLVLRSGTVLAGPRTIDLRAEAAEHLGVGMAAGTLGARERWRVELDPVPSELPLRGFVWLGWANEIGVVGDLTASTRLDRLLRHRGTNLPLPDPNVLLELARLPALGLVRPRSWEALPAAVDHLLRALPP